MVDEFDEERARALTIESLRHAAMTLKVNRELVMKLLLEELGCPDETEANAFIVRTQLLLGLVAGYASNGMILDAAKKPTATSKEVH